MTSIKLPSISGVLKIGCKANGHQAFLSNVSTYRVKICDTGVMDITVKAHKNSNAQQVSIHNIVVFERVQG
jgi:hypothetical protein